jgi:xanthine dehydrogenase accessory factor
VVAVLAGLTAPAWLFTVTATWGSSPRPVGSLLVIDAAGRETGSVSGGCVEADLLARARTGALPAAGEPPRWLRYGDHEGDGADARRLGLPCGGLLELLCEAIDDPAPWLQLQALIAERRATLRRVCLATGHAHLDDAAAAGPALHRTGSEVSRRFLPPARLLIIGAEAIAGYLAPIATMLGYAVTLCDPRPGRLAPFADRGLALDARMPDDCVRALADDPRAAVVALSHDPRLDDLALLEALPGRAFYVGALGSRRTQAARRERLAGLGLPAAALARLHGPVGLDLGGKAPAEIAVAIAAELVQCQCHATGRLPQGAGPGAAGTG